MLRSSVGDGAAPPRVGGFSSPFPAASRTGTPAPPTTPTTTPGSTPAATAFSMLVGGGLTASAVRSSSSTPLSSSSSLPTSGFTSPFSSLASTPQNATTAKALAAFPPPSFGIMPTPPVAASSLSFPAPAFGVGGGSGAGGGFPLHFASAPVSAANSNVPSFPSSHLNSAPASSFPSQMASLAVSRIPSGPSSAQQSKAGSPRLSAAGTPGEPANFTPLGGSALGYTGSKGGHVGVFNSTPSPHGPHGLTPFAFPTPATGGGGLQMHIHGHHSLNGTPSATPLNVSLPNSLAASPLTSPLSRAPGGRDGPPALFLSGTTGGNLAPPTSVPPPGMLLPKALAGGGSHLKPLAIHSENSSARTTPTVATRSLIGGSAASIRRPSSSQCIAEDVEDPLSLPASILSFPPSLRASTCSALASLLAPDGLTPRGTPANEGRPAKPAFFVTTPANTPSPSNQRAASSSTSAPPSTSGAPSLQSIMAGMNFSLSSLVVSAAASAPAVPAAGVFLEQSSLGSASSSSDSSKKDTGATLGLKPFDFSEPSPDDVMRARLQSTGAPSRAADVAAAEKAEHAREKAIRRKKVKGSGGRLAEEADDDDEDGFLHATDRRSHMGSLVQLSSGGGGPSSNPLAALASQSKLVLSSRPFQALYKSLIGLKRQALEDLFRGAHVAALLAQQVVREPRRRELAARNGPDGAAAAAVPAAQVATSSSSASSSSAASSDAAALSVLTEPYSSKGSAGAAAAAISAFTPTTMPYQLHAFQMELQRLKARGASSALQEAKQFMPDEARKLYERKARIYSSDKLQLPVSTASLAEQSIELVTPTAFSSHVASLATLNMLVVGSAGSGVSTLLGNFLYQLGRLPFSLVKPKSIPPNYWEQFNGQQLFPQAITSSVTTNPLYKLNAWNAAKHNFKGYTHCFYTNRYRVNVLHANMGGILQPPTAAAAAAATPTSAAGSSSSKKLPPATPQQTSLSILAALQADFVLLVLDASSGATFAPTPLMQQQLLIAHTQGVRHVILALTKLDGGNSAWSEKKVAATVAAVVSSFLKPLGFQSAQVVNIPLSGLTGENLVTRQNKELGAWYDGPTLHQLIDRVTLPQHKQVESIADRRLTVQILDKPRAQMSILNEATLDTVRLRVQVVSGLLLHSEPVALLNAARGPIGPVGVTQLEREEKTDERDTRVYLDEEDNVGAPTTTIGGGDAKVASTKKVTHDAATGKKLTNAERKAALAAAKREHQRAQDKLKQGKKSTWKPEKYEEEEGEDEEAAAASEDAQQEDVDQVSTSSSLSSVAAGASSSSSSSASVGLSAGVSVSPVPLLVPGEVGSLTLVHLRPPASNADDDLTTLLTGRNPAEAAAETSKQVLAHIADNAGPGDFLVLPVDGADGVRPVVGFKAEVLALTTWPADSQLKAGQGVTLVPLRGALPSPASVAQASPASLYGLLCPPPARAPPLGCQVVLMDRLVNVLNKASRAVARKKPEFLAGPPVDGHGVCLQAGEIATVDFTSSKPLVLEPFHSGGPRMANFLLVHAQEVIGLATITHINAYA